MVWRCGLESLFQLALCFWFADVSYQVSFPFLQDTARPSLSSGIQLDRIPQLYCCQVWLHDCAPAKETWPEVPCVISGQTLISSRYTSPIVSVPIYQLNRKNSAPNESGSPARKRLGLQMPWWKAAGPCHSQQTEP